MLSTEEEQESTQSFSRGRRTYVKEKIARRCVWAAPDKGCMRSDPPRHVYPAHNNFMSRSSAGRHPPGFG